MRILEVHGFFSLFSLIKFLTLIFKEWNENFLENWDLFLKISQFFGYKWEFLVNFGISEKIEKIETFISENLKKSLGMISIFSYGPPLFYKWLWIQIMEWVQGIKGIQPQDIYIAGGVSVKFRSLAYNLRDSVTVDQQPKKMFQRHLSKSWEIIRR